MKLEKQGKPGRQPNARLRQQRLLRGWSLQRVVEELCKLAAEEERLPGVNEAMVSNWENGRKKPSPFYTEQLSRLLSYRGSENEEDMTFDPSRRETILKLLSMAGVAALAPVNDELWERLSRAASKPSSLHTSTLDHFEHLLGECWKLCDRNELEIAAHILSSFLPYLICLCCAPGKAISSWSGAETWSTFVKEQTGPPAPHFN